jgi:dipeptidyl aminopeptidase/acylaminoacyl peptidase
MSSRRRLARRVTATLLAVGCVLVGAWFTFRAGREKLMGMRPPREPVVRPTADPDFAKLRDVAFRTADGLLLRGWYAPSMNRAAVVLAHGYASNRGQLLPEARVLMRAGYGVLVFDFRAQGESEGDHLSFGDLERRDVRAAIDFVAAQPDVAVGRVGTLGFSAGSAPVALVSADDQRVRAVVVESTSTSVADALLDWSGRLGWLRAAPALVLLRASGIDVAAIRTDRAVARLSPRSLLLIHGDQEPETLQARMRQLYDAASMPKRLLVVRGAAHGKFLQAPGAAEYERELLSLFDGALCK